MVSGWRPAHANEDASLLNSEDDSAHVAFKGLVVKILQSGEFNTANRALEELRCFEANVVVAHDGFATLSQPRKASSAGWRITSNGFQTWRSQGFMEISKGLFGSECSGPRLA